MLICAFSRLVCASLVALTLSGCNSLYKTTASLLVDYSEEEATPFVLASPDASMGCGLGEAYGLFLLSFERVHDSTDRMGILLKTLAGVCSEHRAWEEELRHLRAVRNQDTEGARDARIGYKRYLSQAAKRQYQGYLYTVRAFGEPGYACPAFEKEEDEFLYLMGLVSGIQAVLNHIGADQQAAVPMSIAAKVSRGATCLDPDKWWGTPLALEAAIWATIPGVQTGTEDPIERLKRASAIGLTQGVRLSQVFEAQIYWARGDLKGAKQVVKTHAEAIRRKPPDPRLKLMDRISTLQLQFLSDKLWTRAKGHRTPMGRLGHFWDDHEEVVPELDIDELL